MKHFSRDGLHRITLEVNGVSVRAHVEPRLLACDFIRHTLGLTGTHVGCEHGVCGACTVTVNGEPARSCLLFAVQLDGAALGTVEGDAREDRVMDALRRAFKRHHALQCGFCTAGILMSCAAFLRDCATPDEEQVREMLSGHLCRCTGYTPIVTAVLDAAAELQHAVTNPEAG